MELITFKKLKEITNYLTIIEGIETKLVETGYASSFPYKKLILYNYNYVVEELSKVFKNNINLINYNLIHILAHEIVHIEHADKEVVEDTGDALKVYECNNKKSSQYTPINRIYYKSYHNHFIDEYCADILGHLYTLEFLINNNIYNMSKKDYYEVNKEIAYQIMTFYNNGYPIEKYEHLIEKNNIINILMNRILYNIPISSWNKKRFVLIKPDEDAINNTDFDKLMYGEKTNLIGYIRFIEKERIKTVHIFEYLYKKSEKTYQKRLTNKK